MESKESAESSHHGRRRVMPYLCGTGAELNMLRHITKKMQTKTTRGKNRDLVTLFRRNLPSGS